jgi:ABC-type transporter Mla subunit MlaD
MTATVRRRHFWTGLTFGAVVGAAIALSLVASPSGLRWSHDVRTFYVMFREAHGLRPSSPVLVSGIHAGSVRAVHLVEAPPLGWRVAIEVQVSDWPKYAAALTANLDAEPGRSALLGETVLRLSPGPSPGRPLIPLDIVTGREPLSPESILRDVGLAASRLQDFVDGDKPGDPSLRRAMLAMEHTLLRLRDFAERLPR